MPWFVDEVVLVLVLGVLALVGFFGEERWVCSEGVDGIGDLEVEVEGLREGGRVV